MMVEVDDLFPGERCRTRVWVSTKAAAAMADFVRKREQPRGDLVKRLRRYATNGFALYEGPDRPIRLEWRGVYRIGHAGSLFRLIGFYGNDERTEFIVMDAFLKKGQTLNASERSRIDEVARVCRDRLWKKRWVHGQDR